MGEILKKRLKQGQIIGHPVSEFTYNVMVAAEYVARLTEEVAAPFGISLGQFSVLRILRAAGGALPRKEIGRRMVDRNPDVTRTIDKLERVGLVERSKGQVDRRQSLNTITQKGLDLLAQMDPIVQQKTADFGKLLSMPEWIALNTLLERVYEADVDEE